MAKYSAPTNVCDFCADNIFGSQRLWAVHHGRAEDLEISAQLHCIFCTSILDDITEQCSSLEELSWPVYKWNVHQIARTRDLPEILSIIFSPLQVAHSRRNGKSESLLPNRMFYLYHENDLGRIPEAHELGPSTNCPQSWQQVHTWIDTCLTQHPKCRREAEGPLPLPTRLLDISDVTIDDVPSGRIRLVKTENGTVTGPYTTLSHSWGPNPCFIKVRAEDEHDMMTTGITLDDTRLSNNFRDAIVTSRHLKIKYMWMDSLCILQQNAEDFSKEAPRMHIYYRNSFCNIAAADSKLPKQGLFRERSKVESLAPKVLAKYHTSHGNKIFGDQNWLILPFDLWQREVLLEPLYSRGWVFQERMLAPRIVHFAKTQIFFECATISACESLPDKLPRAVDARAATDRHWRERLQKSLSRNREQLFGTEDFSVDEFWKTSIGTYTRCELTDGKDKLVAISGVATLVGEALKEPYGYGLWAARLEEQLAWRVIDCKQANGSMSRRPMPMRYPSWSWASIDGIVDLQHRLPPPREYLVKDHGGNTIKFKEQAANEGISVPDALLKGLRETSSEADKGGVTTWTKMWALSASTQAELTGGPANPLVAPSIEIKAYIRSGQISFDLVQGKWTLRSDNIDSLRQGAEQRLVEVFPDEAPPEINYACAFIVLAYSRVKSTVADDFEIMENFDEVEKASQDDTDVKPVIRNWSSFSGTAPPPTFKGIGLVVHEVCPDHYVRVGSFVFNDLLEEQLQTLVPVASEDKDLGPAINVYLH